MGGLVFCLSVLVDSGWGRGGRLVVGMFDYLLIYDKQEGMLEMSRLCYHA